MSFSRTFLMNIYLHNLFSYLPRKKGKKGGKMERKTGEREEKKGGKNEKMVRKKRGYTNRTITQDAKSYRKKFKHV